MGLFENTSDSLVVTILLLPESSLMSLASCLDPMRAANRIAGKRLFEWTVLSLDGAFVRLSSGQKIYPDGAFSQAHQGDLLICIAAFNHQQYMPAAQLQTFKSKSSHYRYLGAIESASWILARAGYLSGLSATTHWEDLEDFRDQHPQVKVVSDRYIIEGDIFTSAGASPTLDLFLQLIRSRYGDSLALEVAGVFIYDGAHPAQTPQPQAALGYRQHQSPKLNSAIKLMEQHIDTPIAIHSIADSLACSTRALELLFQGQLKTSPHQYYLRLRLQTARRLVVDTQHNMQEIALRSGFNSLAVFSRAFSRFFKLSPTKYRQQQR